MPNGSSSWGLYLWALLASFAGAVTSLSARPFENMTRAQVSMALVASASFGFFVGPLVAQLLFDEGREDIRVLGAVLFVMSSASNILLPLAVKKLSQLFGVPTNGGNGEPGQ
jgi:hypothetical protein